LNKVKNQRNKRLTVFNLSYCFYRTELTNIEIEVIPYKERKVEHGQNKRVIIFDKITTEVIKRWEELKVKVTTKTHWLLIVIAEKVQLRYDINLYW